MNIYVYMCVNVYVDWYSYAYTFIHMYIYAYICKLVREGGHAHIVAIPSISQGVYLTKHSIPGLPAHDNKEFQTLKENSPNTKPQYVI